ncbi:hypothetical protein ACHAPT_003818 [Fusarium lateritium]
MAKVLALASLSITISILDIFLLDPVKDFISLVDEYNLPKAILLKCGSRSVFEAERRVLRDSTNQLAVEFKKSAQDESQMAAVAGSILAQISVTSLTLDNLSNMHWVARGSFTMALVTSIFSVYYAGSQYLTLARCSTADQLKSWIQVSRDETQSTRPSVAAVLTMSAPTALLSLSVYALLVGFGVYFALTWTEGLDTSSSPNDSRSVFIVYIVVLSVIYVGYRVARALLQANASSESGGNRQTRNEEDIGMQTLGARAGEIASSMREAARLRRQLADVEERVASILELERRH